MGSQSTSGSLFENDDESEIKPANTVDTDLTVLDKIYVEEYIWINIAIFVILHAMFLHGIYLAFTSMKWATLVFMFFTYWCCNMGITAGAHRLWSHRAYKAKWPLRLILVLFNTLSFQGHILAWSRDHRVHHKYSDTLADPYSAARGFFFSHVGWLLCRKHPAVIEKGKGIDISDLEADPLLIFQKKYYAPLMIALNYAIPTLVPFYFWDETLLNAMYSAFTRHTLITHAILNVNSFAHAYGSKPYDRNIRPVSNKMVSLFIMGEGWHNYHHTFPWDYRTSEWGNYSLNFTNAFIDFFAWIGWAYDLKTVSPDIIKKRVLRTGDGSHEVWGWGDKDLSKDDIDATVFIN